MHAKIIGPYHDGEHSLSKAEVEKATGVDHAANHTPAVNVCCSILILIFSPRDVSALASDAILSPLKPAPFYAAERAPEGR